MRYNQPYGTPPFAPPAAPAPTQGSIDRRRKIAEALMRAGQQGLQGSGQGRMYRAPSTGATIASALSQIIGGYQAGKAEREQTALDEDTKRKEQERNRQIAEVLSRQNTDPTFAEGIKALPAKSQEQILAQLVTRKALPKEQEGFTLTPGQTRYAGDGTQIASAPAGEKLPEGMRRNEAGALEYDPAYIEGQERLRAAGRPGTTQVNVNTEKGLYSAMSNEMGKQYTEQYNNAQRGPELVERARRIKGLLGNGQPITGAGANFLLQGAKIAAQFGFNTGNAAADTEALGRDLAASTLDAIKASGLGAGNGFSNADRDFLQKVAGGDIGMEADTLARLADLNERAALSTIARWNDTSKRLSPEQLKTLGMTQVEAPPRENSRLQRNPDGSYIYSPR